MYLHNDAAMLPIPKLVQPLASMIDAAAPAVYFSIEERNSESESCKSLKGVQPTVIPDQWIYHEPESDRHDVEGLPHSIVSGKWLRSGVGK